LELDRAQNRLRDALESLRKLRDRQGVIDPRKEAEGLGKVLDDLRLGATKLRATISADSKLLSEGAPQVVVEKARLSATEGEIAQLEARLTQSAGSSQSTISFDIVAYDEADIERRVAQSQFSAAATSFERARVDAERKTMYVHTFVEPELAQESLYPRRFWSSAAAAAAIVMLWLVGNLAWFAGRERGMFGAA
jgi:capsular polysaccharide transport system permease protein